MITIHHVLKNGTEVEDITGHVIKADEYPVLYEVISRISNRKDQDDDQNHL